MLIRGPTGRVVFGIECSHVRWHDPPITNRSPCRCAQPQRLAATARAQRENPCGAEADDGNHGVLGAAAADLVAVPGDAVVAVAVEAQTGGGERLAELAAVGVVEPSAHLLEPRVRGGLLDEVVEADQPRHVEHALVHLPALGAPRDAAS